MCYPSNKSDMAISCVEAGIATLVNANFGAWLTNEPPTMLHQDEHHLRLCAAALTASTGSTLHVISDSGKQR